MPISLPSPVWITRSMSGTGQFARLGAKSWKVTRMLPWASRSAMAVTSSPAQAGMGPFASGIPSPAANWSAPPATMLVGSISPDDRRLAYKRTARAGKIKLWEVATGRECRTFSRYKPFHSADISPNGRFMVTAGNDGIRIWDLTAAKEYERELAHLDRGPCSSAHFHPDGGSLITSESTGLYRRPILPDSRAGHCALRIGPPQLLAGRKRRTERFSARTAGGRGGPAPGLPAIRRFRTGESGSATSARKPWWGW